MRHIFWLLIIAFIPISCRTVLYTEKISDKTDISGKVIYNLPQTALNIRFETATLLKMKGPFALYASKYLGESKAVMLDEQETEIREVSIEPVPVCDTSAFFSLTIKGKKDKPQIFLSPEAFLTGINSESRNTFYIRKTHEVRDITSGEKNSALNYSDISLTSNLETRYDTVFREVFRDSVFVKIPVIKQQTVNKSTEDRAKELAEQIFLLRDDKNALLKGENDGGKIPDFQTFEYMINRLSALERDYKSMFTGKISEDKSFFEFQYIPRQMQKPYIDTIFRFSGKFGILPADSEAGMPILISVTPLKKHQSFRNSFQQRAKGIAYRIPDDALIEIFLGEDLIFQSQIPVSQFGIIKRLPVSNDPKIEFYFDYGAVKSFH